MEEVQQRERESCWLVWYVAARQCSLRGGDLRLTVRRDDGRIDVAGRSSLVLTGTIHITAS